MTVGRRNVLVNVLTEGLLTNLDEETTNILPEVLWQIIASYWFQLNRFHCPLSGELFSEPVIINHPNVAPIIYNRSAVIEAINRGELNNFDINADNYETFLLRVPIEITSLFNNPAAEEKTIPADPLISFLNNPTHQNISFVNEYKQDSRSNNNAPLFDLLNSSVPSTLRITPIKKLPLVLASLSAAFALLSEATLEGSNEMVFSWRNQRALTASLPFVFGYVGTNAAIDYHFMKNLLARKNKKDLFVIAVLNIFITRLLMTPLIYLSYKMGFNKPDTAFNLAIPLAYVFSTSLSARFLSSLHTIVKDCQDRRFISHDRQSLLMLALMSLIPLTYYGLTDYRDIKLGLQPNYFNSTNLILNAVISTIIALPVYYLATRESSYSLLQFLKAPREILLPRPGREEEAESKLKFGLRTSARFSASIFVGIIAFLSAGDPAIAILAALSMYILGALTKNSLTYKNPYRLMPANRNSSVQITVIPAERLTVRTPLLNVNNTP